MNWLDLAAAEPSVRISGVILLALVVHLAVRIVRRGASRFMSAKVTKPWAKLRTVSSLVVSALVFFMYFGAVGLLLREFGVSLTAYLASASILGLAIGFGSQGLVQDVVTGLTLIFSDLFHVGDMVEISGQTGIVRSIGMRFTVMINAFGAEVFVPNRTISSVIAYPRGYVRCLVDVSIAAENDKAAAMEAKIRALVAGAEEQFSGVLRREAEIEAPCTTRAGRTFIRVKFRIWPGRGAPLETAFKQELVQTLKAVDPGYTEWMVSVNYEVETTPFVKEVQWRRTRT